MRIAPWPVELSFTRLPRRFAVEYWHRTLPGPVGAVSIRPHVLASRDDELPVLMAEALRVTGGGRRRVFGRYLAGVPAGRR